MGNRPTGYLVTYSAFAPVRLISPARVHALLRPPAAVLRAYVQWFGVDVPQDLPAGDYTGTITINLDAVSQEAAAAVFKVALTVQGGEPIPNAGADDLWRMSRLGWLDSTVGIDRNITAGFDELQLSRVGGNDGHAHRRPDAIARKEPLRGWSDGD